MEIPHDFTSFWCTQVLPEKPCKVVIQPDSECTITNIALHLIEGQEFPNGSRAVLYVSVNNGAEVAITPFTVGQFESACVDIAFSESDNIVFTIKGANIPFDIVGNYIGDIPIVDNGVPPKELPAE